MEIQKKLLSAEKKRFTGFRQRVVKHEGVRGINITRKGEI